jgi:hypothetical protein
VFGSLLDGVFTPYGIDMRIAIFFAGKVKYYLARDCAVSEIMEGQRRKQGRKGWKKELGGKLKSKRVFQGMIMNYQPSIIPLSCALTPHWNRSG